MPTVFHLSLLKCDNDMLNTSERSLFFLCLHGQPSGIPLPEKVVIKSRNRRVFYYLCKRKELLNIPEAVERMAHVLFRKMASPISAVFSSNRVC